MDCLICRSRRSCGMLYRMCPPRRKRGQRFTKTGRQLYRGNDHGNGRSDRFRNHFQNRRRPVECCLCRAGFSGRCGTGFFRGYCVGFLSGLGLFCSTVCHAGKIRSGFVDSGGGYPGQRGENHRNRERRGNLYYRGTGRKPLYLIPDKKR